MTCDHCFEDKDDVGLATDPLIDYLYAPSGAQDWSYWCTNCLHRRMDI